MTDTKALGALADVICRAQANGRRTPMGIALAIESARMLMSPETAVELEALRARADEVERKYSFDTAELKKQTAEARAERADQHDDLAHALGRSIGTEWSDLISIAASAVEAEETARKLRARVAELEAETYVAPSPSCTRCYGADAVRFVDNGGATSPCRVCGPSEVERLRARVAELESAQVSDAYPHAMPWAKWLDAEDLADFLDELAAAAITNVSSARALAEVEETCARWRTMADATRAHLTAPGPNCRCPEPVLECTDAWCGCPVCHRAVVPVPAVLAKRAESEGLPVTVAMSERVGSRLRRLGNPLDRGVRS